MFQNLSRGMACSILVLFAACHSEKPTAAANIAPQITSFPVVHPAEDVPYRFRVAFTDLDGPDTSVNYCYYPSWLTADADSLYGTPQEGNHDSSFTVIVGDGLAADTVSIQIRIIRVNDPPLITSPDTLSATGGIPVSYAVVVVDPEADDVTISYQGLPSWLVADGDSLSGIPPDGLPDTAFIVVASDGHGADTVRVRLRMIPCLVVYGDTRTNHQAHRAVVAGIEAVKPCAVFHVGDLVEDGTSAALWDTFNVITAGFRATAEFFPALGNHEHQAQLYFDQFTLPNNEQWYSAERNGVHFIVLNTCVAIDPASAQYQWLQQDLAGIGDSVAFIVAVFHHSPYSSGPHIEDEQGLRAKIIPLLEQFGVDLVFSGHDHDYERSFCNGIFYIVTGGGGAPLSDQTRQIPCRQLFIKEYEFCKLSAIDNRLIVTVYNPSMQVIDTATLTR